MSDKQGYNYRNFRLTLEELKQLQSGKAIQKAADGFRIRLVCREDARRKKLEAKIAELQAELKGRANGKTKSRIYNNKKECDLCHKFFKKVNMHKRLVHQEEAVNA